LFIVRIIRNR